jgi:hypothetical protein
LDETKPVAGRPSRVTPKLPSMEITRRGIAALLDMATYQSTTHSIPSSINI